MAEYTPEWTGVFENYSRAFVARNAWRVRYIMSEEDALQECALVFARCVHHYAGKIDNAPWFMALFKRAVANEFHFHASACTRIREAEAGYAGEQSRRGEGVDHNLGTLTASIASASEELRAVLRVVAQAPTELLSLLLLEASDENWSRRLCRISGINKVSKTIVAELRDILTEDQS